MFKEKKMPSSSNLLSQMTLVWVCLLQKKKKKPEKLT